MKKSVTASIISDIWEVVKSRRFDILIGVSVILLSLLSFAIGYLVAKEELKKDPVRIEMKN